MTAQELAEKMQSEINEYRTAKTARKNAQNVVGELSQTDYDDDEMSTALAVQREANNAFAIIEQKLWIAVEKSLGRGGREVGNFWKIADGKAI